MKRSMIMVSIIMSFLFCDAKDSTKGVWFREIPHPQTGELVTLELDMRTGYAIANQHTIYIIVKDKKSGENITMAFVNGDYFITEMSYWKTEYEDECIGEDIDLESYLKKSKSQKLERLEKK